MRKIIIPAAGKATRFNGVLKEFADVGGEYALQRAVRMAVEKFHATHVVIVTNADKVQDHIDFIRDVLTPLFPLTAINLVMQTSFDRDLLNAIVAGLSTYPIDIDAGLILPDSVFAIDTMPLTTTYELSIGVFETDTPDRYSILGLNSIITKPEHMPKGIYQAWGTLLWSNYISEDMLVNEHKFGTYDMLFSYIMRVYGFNTFKLNYYYDIGSIERYMEFLEDTV